MSYWNENFHNKAYLLEFKIGEKTETTYVFSLPPQSEEFTHPQRISETKVFGGSVFEDYGNDVISITLSGTTANNNLRLITKSDVQYEMTGEEAVFDLQKTIEMYGKKEKLDNKKVYLYSQDSKDCKNWQIVIKEFNIKRSKDNPTAYSFTLSATGISLTENRTHNLAAGKSFIDNLNETVSNVCKKILAGTSALKDGLGYYTKGLDLLVALDNCVTKVEDSLFAYVNLASQYIDTTSNYINETLSLGDHILSSVARITLGSGLTLFNDVAQLNQAAHDVYVYCSDFPEDNIYIDIINGYKQTAKDIKNIWIEVASENEYQSAEAKALVKNYSNVVGVSVLPGNSETDDTVIINYGYKQKIVTESDTWDSLAQTYYQNTKLSSLIALYNGLDDNNDVLVVGNTIRIPIISKTDSNKGDNLIYTNPEDTDNYGTDILINDEGDFSIEKDDLGTVDGIKNLSQSINARLQTGLGSRVQLVAYGIRNSIGSPSLVENYIISSIRETLLSDPRVKTVDKITFKGSGDVINVSVIYTDINNIEQSYGGTI